MMRFVLNARKEHGIVNNGVNAVIDAIKEMISAIPDIEGWGGLPLKSELTSLRCALISSDRESVDCWEKTDNIVHKYVDLTVIPIWHKDWGFRVASIWYEALWRGGRSTADRHEKFLAILEMSILETDTLLCRLVEVRHCFRCGSKAYSGFLWEDDAIEISKYVETAKHLRLPLKPGIPEVLVMVTSRTREGMTAIWAKEWCERKWPTSTCVVEEKTDVPKNAQ